jgi:hypothetical protein
MRIPPIAITVLGLGLLAACGPAVQHQPGNAAPVGSASPSASTPAGDPPGSPAASPNSGNGTRPAAAPTATAVAASARCHTNQLRAEIDLIFPNGQSGAGQDALLGLTNNGAPCTMYGYVGMQLYTEYSKALPTKVVRADDTPVGKPTHFTLPKGQTAWTILEWFETPAGDEDSECGGKVFGQKIIPPDETTQLTTSTEMGHVCDHGTVNLGPMTLKRPQLGS